MRTPDLLNQIKSELELQRSTRCEREKEKELQRNRQNDTADRRPTAQFLKERSEMI